MMKKFKSFYNKDRNDFSTGYVDPFEFHMTFYKMMVYFKVADLKNKDPPSYCNQNAILFITGLLASVLIFISFCHAAASYDFILMTETGTYTIVLAYEILILSATRRNLPQFHNLLRSLQEDFKYICSTGDRYRARFFENQLKTWKICIVTCIFCAVTPIGMVMFAFLSLFYFLATYKEDVGGSRPLLFPFWLPDVDFGKSPVYESAFMYANICALLYGYNFTFMLQTQIVWIRQITSKVDIIIWSLKDLLIDIHPATSKEESLYFSYLIDTRMRDIIKHHQSMYRTLMTQRLCGLILTENREALCQANAYAVEWQSFRQGLIDDYTIVYKKFLLYEQQLCSPVVCLTAYCFAEKLDEGEVQVILIMLCVATIILVFIPSLLCTYLAFKVHSVCDECLNIPFWNAGPVLRPYMVLIMQRSQRSLPLTAPGFEDISIETFSKKMTNAYSLFNMLRQTNL